MTMKKVSFLFKINQLLQISGSNDNDDYYFDDGKYTFLIILKKNF